LDILNAKTNSENQFCIGKLKISLIFKSKFLYFAKNNITTEKTNIMEDQSQQTSENINNTAKQKLLMGITIAGLLCCILITIIILFILIKKR
jgi:lipopolysaccharide/colanic/teichoic acid biosynthesis glycosyltransferase